MTRLTPIETRRAGPDDDACPACAQPIQRDQRLALVHHDQLGHAWVHVRHILDQEAKREA